MMDLEEINKQSQRELAEWLRLRRYMRATYPRERFRGSYEGGASLHISKDGRFQGVW